jgi:hypothetical protein
MSNPRKDSALKAKSTGISLPPELARAARMHAYSNGMSLSKFVSQLLLRELKTMGSARLNPVEAAQAKSSISLDDSTNQFPQKRKPHQSSDELLAKTR